MKKLVTGVILAAIVVGAVLVVQTLPVQLSMLKGKRARVTRGDLNVDITATGTIEPGRRSEIKSKASGEVLVIHHNPGDIVEKGDLLIVLKKVDEERNRDIALREEARAEANLKKAKITLEQRRRTVPIEKRRAAASVAAAESDLNLAGINLKRVKDQSAVRAAADIEVDRFQASFYTAQASLNSAKANYDSAVAAELNIDLAEADVVLAVAALESVQTSLADALERLDETEVKSPIPGMVTRTRGMRFVQIGEVIQDGKRSLTGGTVLMEVADITELYVMASVDSADIGRILEIAPAHARPGYAPLPTKKSPGQDADPPAEVEVEVTVEAFLDEKFTGVIERILPEPNQIGAVQTYDVRIRITSPNRKMLGKVLGLQAEVKFAADSRTNVLLIPYDAARRDANDIEGVYVPVTNEAGEVEDQFRPCRFGINNGMFVEVLEGLSEGEEVYTQRPRLTRRQREARQDEN